MSELIGVEGARVVVIKDLKYVSHVLQQLRINLLGGLVVLQHTITVDYWNY